ncbi:MAG TPA: hypothetical protein V6C58_06145 [Allocoleopsis sp.]
MNQTTEFPRDLILYSAKIEEAKLASGILGIGVKVHDVGTHAEPCILLQDRDLVAIEILFSPHNQEEIETDIAKVLGWLCTEILWDGEDEFQFLQEYL